MRLINIFMAFLSLLAMAVTAEAKEAKYAYENAGPYTVTKDRNVGPDNDYTVYRPATLEQSGTKYGVLTWGNGTFMSPSNYEGLLSHFASYGFIVVAAQSSMTGSGDPQLKGLAWLLQEAQNPAGMYYQKIHQRNCAIGHSQGGYGTLLAAKDPRVYCNATFGAVYTLRANDIQGPSFFIAGEKDRLAGAYYIKRMYEASSAEAVLGVLKEAGHFTVNGSATPTLRHYLTAWFLYQIYDDSLAATQFRGPQCQLCVDPLWEADINY